MKSDPWGRLEARLRLYRQSLCGGAGSAAHGGSARDHSRSDRLPTDPAVHIVTAPEETIAVLRFSGSGEDMAARQAELFAQLSDSQWKPEGSAHALFYDAPFTLPFLRRNEAAVLVKELNSD